MSAPPHACYHLNRDLNSPNPDLTTIPGQFRAVPYTTAMMDPMTIKIDYPDGMSEVEKQAMDEKLNALFETRGFASEAEMEEAIQVAVQEHLGLEMQFTPSPAQLWLERIPLILSAVILVVGLYWRYGLGH